MTTLSYRTAQWPPRWRSWPARGFERMLSYLTLIADAFAESRDMARKAHKRYPFAEW